MKRHFRAAALLCVTPFLLESPLAAAQATAGFTSKTNATRPAPAPKRVAGEYELGPGDRVKISAYQREDLSGIFGVRPDGMVSVPLIGKFAAAGHTPAELEQNLTDAIARVTGRTVSVSIEVETWRQVAAVGDVDKPGTFAFTPGMTVLHALAAAGGIFRPLRDVSQVEITRQSANVVQVTERLKTALAERARIVAEQRGQDVVEASRRLLKLASSAEVKRLIELENKILQENKDTLRIAYETKEEQIGHFEREIKAYQEQRKELKKRIELVSEELAKYGELASKGLARSARTLQLRTEVANLEGTSHAVLASIARSERNLLEAAKEKETLQVTKRLELDQQLSKVEGDIRELERSLGVYEDLILRLSASSVADVTASRIVKTYEIVRASKSGHEILPATETTLLQPGDVVRVTTAKEAGTDAAAITVPQRTR